MRSCSCCLVGRCMRRKDIGHRGSARRSCRCWVCLLSLSLFPDLRWKEIGRGRERNSMLDGLDVPAMTCARVIFSGVPCRSDIVTLLSVECCHSILKSDLATMVEPELGLVTTTAARLYKCHDETGVHLTSSPNSAKSLLSVRIFEFFSINLKSMKSFSTMR